MVCIENIENVLHKNNVIFLTYGGTFTQALIAGMTGVLEKEVEDANLSMKISNNIFVTFIELAQNVMNYSKEAHTKNISNTKALIFVGKQEDEYFVCSQNVITKEDKEKIEPILQKVTTSTLEEIKKQYKEIRRASRDTKSVGAGLGFYEIAKKVTTIDYEFIKQEDGNFSYKICTTF